jgi:type II secretory pathway pseudopilin PulG
VISSKKTEVGITLIEIMLVLVIAASLLYMGMQQYYSYKRDADVYQVRANVNAIFHGAAKFYRAQCYGSIDPNTRKLISGTGLLNLSATPPPTNPYILNIATDLIATGYLPPNTIVLSPLVDSSVGTDGYVVQFNEYTQPVNACQTGTGAWGPTPAMGCTTNARVGTLVIWKTQIAVQLQDATTAAQYLALLDGDCLSSLESSTTGTTAVTPCANNPVPGNFVVWERLPSASNITLESISPTWISVPTAQRFTSMYQTADTTYLMSVSHSPEVQYFYCGG